MAFILLMLGFKFDLETSIGKYISYSFIIGTFLFSFSIYALAISSGKGKKIKFLGPVTPIGGLLLVLGWSLLLYSFIM